MRPYRVEQFHQYSGYKDQNQPNNQYSGYKDQIQSGFNVQPVGQSSIPFSSSNNQNVTTTNNYQYSNVQPVGNTVSNYRPYSESSNNNYTYTSSTYQQNPVSSSIPTGDYYSNATTKTTTVNVDGKTTGNTYKSEVVGSGGNYTSSYGGNNDLGGSGTGNQGFKSYLDKIDEQLRESRKNFPGSN